MVRRRLRYRASADACANAWTRLREQKLQSATSIGALYDTLDEHLIDELQGAEITFEKAF